MMMLASIAGSRYWLKTIHKKIRIQNLPNGLEGFTVLHISDFHAHNKLHMSVWKKLKMLDFDICTITGDIITSSADELKPHLDHICKLAARKPVFFVSGNHEARSSCREVHMMLKKCGVTVLKNETAEFDFDGTMLRIIGLCDYKCIQKQKINIKPLFDSNFSLVLSHQPQVFDMIKTFDGNSLTLSGHTHAGQVRFPFMPVLLAPGQGLFPKYGYGGYSEGKTHAMWISKGIGTTHFPVRFYNRPEIAVITLANASVCSSDEKANCINLQK